MLDIYRRHLKTCPHRHKGRVHKKCPCPIYYYGRLDGAYHYPKTLSLKSWKAAVKKINRWEERGYVDDLEHKSLEDAVSKYLQERKRLNRAAATVEQDERALMALIGYAKKLGLVYLRDICDADRMRGLYASWMLAKSRKEEGLSPSYRKQMQGRVEKFFKYCAHKTNWLDAEFQRRAEQVLNIDSPEVKHQETLPFKTEEVRAIYDACSWWRDGPAACGKSERLAFCMLQRWSGLRVGDVARLKKSDLEQRADGSGRLFICTAKTGAKVYCPLPAAVVGALNGFRHRSEKYYFWDRSQVKPEVINKTWSAKVVKICKRAGIENGHAHRFRDTFAVELLKTGTPIDRVSKLLGHASIAITIKHYSPWVQALQEQAERDVMRSWGDVEGENF